VSRPGLAIPRSRLLLIAVAVALPTVGHFVIAHREGKLDLGTAAAILLGLALAAGIIVAVFRVAARPRSESERGLDDRALWQARFGPVLRWLVPVSAVLALLGAIAKL